MIYRCQPRPTPYQIVSKAMLDDSRLSPAALGVMTYLIGRPPNWEIKIVQLAQHFNQSQDRIGTIFKELEKLGYARLVSVRRSGKTQFTGKQWEVFELPELNPDVRNRSKTTFITKAKPDFPRQMERPDIGEDRLSENPALIRTEKEEEKEKKIKNKVSVNECVEDTTHTNFLNSFSSSNEKKGPSPQSSGAPPFPEQGKSVEKQILFRESFYYNKPEKFREDLIARHERYKNANTFFYYKRVLNWSDAKGGRCFDWLAMAASFMDGDQGKGTLVTIR
jgi:hypothetical protein